MARDIDEGDTDHAGRELARARGVRAVVRGARWLDADLELRWET